MENGIIIPDELRFAITRKCSGKCRHCYNRSGKGNDLLSGSDFIKILNEVYTLNPDLDRITITGGEPMNEPEKVLEISEFCHTLGIRVRLVTRGWELDEEICRKLKNAGVTRIQIGLDSSGKLGYEDESRTKWDTLHSWLRCDTDGFVKTVEAIKLSIHCGIDTSIRFSLCRSNLNDVLNTYRFVSGLGASKFKFRVLFPDGRAKNRLIAELITAEEMAEAQFQLIQASKTVKTLIEVTQPCLYPLPGLHDLSRTNHEFNAYREACPCGTRAAYIDSNGDVKYCLFDEDALGNVAGTSLPDVWNSEPADKARERRCPLDLSGYNCSAFKILYSQFNDYSLFMGNYAKAVKQKISSGI
jgi:MoaA/NifB/PqqE/SkfB family radical SAM enzyme